MDGAPKDYNEVRDRVLEFREKYPEGSLQQHDLQFIDLGGKSWVVYTAAAYRTPDDPRPGHGSAWEQVPGATNFTRDSELQNAETSAWGRALIAVGAADAKKGIASADEVRNRRVDRTPQPTPADPGKVEAVRNLFAQLPQDVQDAKDVEALVTYASQSDAAADVTLARLTKELKDLDGVPA